MCLFPKQVRVTLKDGHSVPMSVPCGKCIDCLQLRTHDWELRMKYELLNSNYGLFVTLTYDDFSCPSLGVEVSHVQKFIKRLRKHGHIFKYYCIGEYGTSTFRPHYHLIFFVTSDSHSINLSLDINKSWPYGFTQVKPCSFGRIHYCIAYLIGQKSPLGKNKPFTIMSKRPSIGLCALDDKTFVSQLKSTNFEYTFRNGHKVHVPRYYRRKLNDKDFTLIDFYLLKCKHHEQFLKDYKSYLNSKHLDFSKHYNNLDLIKDFKISQSIYNFSHDEILKNRNKKLKND
ncbi:replication initiator protein [Capybara microvirus Cap1_SP_263]|nr:replication initiator protein [Capybara microvirus Cap1_SP_263]